MNFSTMVENGSFHDFQVHGADRRQYSRLSLAASRESLLKYQLVEFNSS